MTTAGKPITCRAAVAWELNKPFSIETVEVAVPQSDEVRVKISSTGLCHSDLSVLEGFDPTWSFPSVMGHEGAGIVESVGEGVTSLKPGDPVVFAFIPYCGQCDFCHSPKTNMCRRDSHFTRINIPPTNAGPRITCRGKNLSQSGSVSTFSEYTVVPEFNAVKVNPKANLKDLCLVGCCVPTGYGAAVKAAKVEPGSTCAIWGLGGVGMCVVMGCRDSGASKIIGIDTNPNKFALAKEFGCTDFLNPKDEPNIPEKLAEMTNGGADYCFVSVGVLEAMNIAFKSSHPAWGDTVVIGVTDMDKAVSAAVFDLLCGRKLRGTSYGDYKAKLAIPDLVDMVIDGKIQLDKLISHRLPLDKINEGYALMKTGESLRAIIDYDMKS